MSKAMPAACPVLLPNVGRDDVGMVKRVSASGSVVVSRPVGEVFAFFADAENDREWRPG
jgi:hypothetical protein